MSEGGKGNPQQQCPSSDQPVEPSSPQSRPCTPGLISASWPKFLGRGRTAIPSPQSWESAMVQIWWIILPEPGSQSPLRPSLLSVGPSLLLPPSPPPSSPTPALRHPTPPFYAPRLYCHQPRLLPSSLWVIVVAAVRRWRSCCVKGCAVTWEHSACLPVCLPVCLHVSACLPSSTWIKFIFECR